ncbi:MAG: cytochrome-c oxidase [Geobacteraceae bacterium GWC2_53_11]|nr:MAG: cytochrome-c oxidase [Geobacteraceae bacterium GWC2_53_11]
MTVCVEAAYADQRTVAGPVAMATSADGADVGLTEHLGARIPLDITFRDESGRQVRLAELINGPTIILPVFFSCANVCYNLQWRLAQVLPKIKRTPDVEYRVISVSFDEHDTPELAAKFKRVYLTAMHAPFPETGWRFLTGDAASIKKLTDAVGFSFQRRGGDFLHPVASIVVTGNGTIVRYLYGATFLPKDLTLALVEAREGKSGTAVRKVLEYCFSYDSRQNSYVFNLLRVSATVVILCAGSFLAFLILTGRKHKKRISKT